MSHVIYSENFLTVCAILAKGDMSRPFENVVKSAENYTRLFNRQFGISESDFRSAILNLFFLHSGRQLGDYLEDLSTGEMCPQILLKEGIHYISMFREVFFNDEGETFLDFETSSYFLTEESRFSRKKAYKEVTDFFKCNSESSPDKIINFIENYRDFVFFEHPGNFRENDLLSNDFSASVAFLENCHTDSDYLIPFLKAFPKCFEILFRCSRRVY